MHGIRGSKYIPWNTFAGLGVMAEVANLNDHFKREKFNFGFLLHFVSRSSSSLVELIYRLFLQMVLRMKWRTMSIFQAIKGGFRGI